MNHARFALAAVLLIACDEKKDAAPTAPSASAAAAISAAPSMTASAAPVASASAVPAASAVMMTGELNDRMVTVKDPAKDKEVTVKVTPGGTLTLFLPDFPGTVWAPDKVDGSLGKPKEEAIPGFAPKTNGHQFKFSAVKGGKWKATFGNKPAAEKTAKFTENFTLIVDAT